MITFLKPVLVLGIFFSVGCVSAKYQKAPKDAPPAISLDLAGTARTNVPTAFPLIEATLQSVIVIGGPGSWKRNAYWDEYILSFTNHGTNEVVVESATLTDFRGSTAIPGTAPWALEKQSRTYLSRISATSGEVLKIGAGSVAASGAVFAVGTTMVGSLSGYVGVGLAISSMAIGLPAYTVGAILTNTHSKHRVEDQFSSRRLTLPLTLASAQRAQGSLFFPITPGPQSLTLHWRAAADTHDLTIELTPLAGLHLKTNPVTSKAGVTR